MQTLSRLNPKPSTPHKLNPLGLGFRVYTIGGLGGCGESGVLKAKATSRVRGSGLRVKCLGDVGLIAKKRGGGGRAKYVGYN